MTEDRRGVDVLDEILRPLGLWVADIAERALPLFEARVPADTRPRDAIEGIRRFGRGGRRTHDLRTLSWAAHAAARDAADPVARSAARTASLAAASAYLHLDVASAHQTRHVLGPGVYGAQAHEWAALGDRAAGDAEIAWAIGHATPAVRRLVRRMPAPTRGRTRLGELFVALDAGLRGL